MARISFVSWLRVVPPSIMLGGGAGAGVGWLVGNPIDGFRVGVICGGVIAFIILKRTQQL